MHPCRYSFPNAKTYDNLQLISSQHSLHLYQPITLPSDYLTGKAAELPTLPLGNDWKDHIVTLSVSGLFGYSNENTPASRVRTPSDESEMCANPSLIPSRHLLSPQHTCQRRESVTDINDDPQSSPALMHKQSIRPSETQSSLKPPVVTVPLVPCDGASPSSAPIVSPNSGDLGGQ